MKKMLPGIFIEQFERGIVSISGNNTLIFNSDNTNDNDGIPWEYRQ
jgi:hypothetical protein